MSQGLAIEDVDQLADRLASRLQVTRLEAVKIALENEIGRLAEAAPLAERLQPLIDRVAARPRGHFADKAFFDSLNDE